MLKYTFAILCIVAASVDCSFVPAPGRISARSDASLAKFLLSRQHQMQRTDPWVSGQCFAIYLPQLETAVDEWKVEYRRCDEEAQNKTDRIAQQMEPQKQELVDSGEGVCSVISECQQINETLKSFNCFADLSQNVLGPIYQISNNASDAASLLLQQLDFVETDRQRCGNDSERAYVEESAKLYNALDACLKNGPPPPITTTTTESSITTEPELEPEPSVEVPGDDGGYNVNMRSQILKFLQQRRTEEAAAKGHH